MGGVFASMYARLLARHEARIIMLGLDASGKTTILYKLKLGEVVTSIPTIGFNVESVEYSTRTSLVSFTTWDVGGRSKIRPLSRHYYSQGNALVFVVDSADRDRYEDARDEIMEMLNEDECLEWPLLVFANKQDLPNAMSVAEITDKLKLHTLRNRTWYVQSCCATTGEGLYEGLDWLSVTLARKSDQKISKTEHVSQNHLNHPSPAHIKSAPKLGEVTESDAETDVPESVDTEVMEQDM